MKLSIIIVSWNVKDSLIKCLRSIEENRPDVPFEIIVVDNASGDEAIEAVKKNFPDVKLIANSENKGFAAANNQGIKIARGEYLLLLNPDTIVHKNAIDLMIKALDEEPQAAVCGPKLRDENGEYYPSTGHTPTMRSTAYHWTFFRNLGIFRSHYKKLKRSGECYDEKNGAEQLSGSALLVRKSVMEETGMFDENFFMYYEDVDLCLRIRNAGWKILFIGEAEITHIGGKSSEQINAKKKYFLCSSALYFFRKYRGKISAALFGLFFRLGVVIKDIITILSGSLSCIFFIICQNYEKLNRARKKVKNSAIFLVKYSWKIYHGPIL